MRKILHRLFLRPLRIPLKTFCDSLITAFFARNSVENIDRDFGFSECVRFANEFWILKEAQKIQPQEIVDNKDVLTHALEKAFATVRYDLRPSEVMGLFNFYQYMAFLRQKGILNYDVVPLLQNLSFKKNIYQFLKFIEIVGDQFFWAEVSIKRDFWPLVQHILSLFESKQALSPNEIITLASFVLKFEIDPLEDAPKLNRRLAELKDRIDFRSFYLTSPPSMIYSFFLLYLYSLKIEMTLIPEKTMIKYLPHIFEQLNEAQYCEVMNQLLLYKGINAALFSAAKKEFMNRIESLTFNNIIQAVKFFVTRYELGTAERSHVSTKLAELATTASKFEAFEYLSFAVRVKSSGNEAVVRKIWDIWGSQLLECVPYKLGRENAGLFTFPLVLLQSFKEFYESSSPLIGQALQKVHKTLLEVLRDNRPLDLGDSLELKWLCQEMFAFCSDAGLIERILESSKESIKEWLSKDRQAVDSLLDVASLSRELHTAVGKLLGGANSEKVKSDSLQALKNYPELMNSTNFMTALQSTSPSVL